MAHKFAEIAFTAPVKAVQTALGSRSVYARRDAGPDQNERLGRAEAEFISARDGFYIGTISEAGWPYVQFRGGPPGFLRVLGDRELGFADFRGNRQYVTTGNVTTNERVSLFLMDYPNQRRLKIFGHMSAVEPGDISKLVVSGYPAIVDRAFRITVDAYDWNCPQHITPRFTEDEIGRVFAAVPGRDAANCASIFRGAIAE